MQNYRPIEAAAFKLRGVAMVPLVVLLGVCRWAEIEHPATVWGIGLPLFSTGLALRIWSQRHLRYRIRGNRFLAVTGPYAHVRNPVYIGNTLLLIGLAVACELVWAAPLVFCWAAIVYGLAVRFEEARLLKRHGQNYQGYLRNVPRWVPASRILARASDGCTHAAGWGVAIAVEWHCGLLLLLPVVKELVGHGSP